MVWPIIAVTAGECILAAYLHSYNSPLPQLVLPVQQQIESQDSPGGRRDDNEPLTILCDVELFPAGRRIVQGRLKQPLRRAEPNRTWRWVRDRHGHHAPIEREINNLGAILGPSRLHTATDRDGNGFARDGEGGDVDFVVSRKGVVLDDPFLIRGEVLLILAGRRLEVLDQLDGRGLERGVEHLSAVGALADQVVIRNVGDEDRFC